MFSIGTCTHALLSQIDNEEFIGLKKTFGVNGVGEYLNLVIHIKNSNNSRGIFENSEEMILWAKSSMFSESTSRYFISFLCGEGLLEYEEGFFYPNSILFDIING